MTTLNTTFFNITSNFSFEASILTFQKTKSGINAIWKLKAREKAAKAGMTQAITSWECYSEYCPDFIHVNANDLTVRVDGAKTFGQEAAGLYVLNILTQNATSGELILLEEFMIFIEYNKTAKIDIDINMPWE